MSGKPVILKPPAYDPDLRRVRWTDELGNRRQESYRTLKEAKAAQQRIASKLERGTRTSRDKLTMQELLREFWDVYAVTHVSQATRQRMYLPAMKNWIYPEMGKAVVSRIDRKSVDSFIGRMVRRGAQPPTIRATLTTLSSVLQRAVEWGYIDVNPARGARRPAEVVEQRAAYEPDEVYKIASGMILDRDKALVAFTAFTGLRQSEVFGLQWAKIFDDHFEVYRPKLKRWDSVPLFAPAREVLDHWRTLAPSQTGLVFPSSTGTSLANQQSAWLRRRWRPGTVRAGMVTCSMCNAEVPSDDDTAMRVGLDAGEATAKLERWNYRGRKGWKRAEQEPPQAYECPCGNPKPDPPASPYSGPEFHELRHTFGTLAAYATGDLLQVAEWMGHSDTKMLAKRYKHQLERGRQRAIDQVNALVSEWTAR